MLQNSKLVPSEVLTHPWLYVSSPHKSSSDSDDKTVCDVDTVGKWLLFHKTQVEVGEKLSPHDKAWQSIQTLVIDPSNTDIISAKSSTNWQGSYAGGATSNGVICCYTADYRDKASVKRAADALRKVYSYPCNMFYKTDEATYAGAYRNQGNKAVSMYKHSLDNQLYERDKTSKWILDSVPNMFVCDIGIPSQVDNLRWLHVTSSNLVNTSNSIAGELGNKNSQCVSSESSKDSLNQTADDESRQPKTVNKASQNASCKDYPQEKINKVTQGNSSKCSQEKTNNVIYNDPSQYLEETINQIFEETSNQFSQDLVHESPQYTSSQYSQETISKIFEDPSFETFEETLPSQPAKRRRNAVEPRNDSSEYTSLLILPENFEDASIQISPETSEDASIQISQETLSKIFEDDSFEPSGSSKTSSVEESVASNAHPDVSFDSGESGSDSEYGSVPRLRWKTSTTVGKWLLFNDTEINPIDKLSVHDRAWEKIKSIVTDPNNVDIISAKCSTNFSRRYAEYASSTGVTCCYTRDYRDKMSVKRAADMIRNALFFTCCIYYKTDDATSAGAYQHFGNTAISMYMHTNGNKMYERDENGKWKLFSI